jgi:hypothetical protein
MDELFEVFDLFVDVFGEGVVTWVLRLVGVVAVLAGGGLWLLTDMGILVLPAALLLIGVVLLVGPSLLLLVTEFA